MGRIISSSEVIGAIKSHGANAVPMGYLECDGASVLRTAYPALFNVIGTTWGAVDGLHFNLPDLRGRTLRGRDHGAGVDPDAGSRTASNSGGATGDNVGSIQGQATAVNGLANSSSSLSGSFSGSTSADGSHTHNFSVPVGAAQIFWTTYANNNAGKGALFDDNLGSQPLYNLVSRTIDPVGNHSHSVSGSISGTTAAQTLSGDTETRMKNANVLFIIKY